MASVPRKTVLTTIDGTPEKRLFLSIISDYDLKTGLCELVDNALDLWVTNERNQKLKIAVILDVHRQLISVTDNAGGVKESQIRWLIAPGATRNQPGEELIGIFGVGGKRAGVALGELVEIRTRFKREKSLQVEITKDWLASDDWNLEIYEIPDIDPATTSVEITKVRQGFNDEDVENIQQHLGEMYSWFIREGCEIELNGRPIGPITFEVWAYPPDFRPRRAAFKITPTSEGTVAVTMKAGLIRDRDPEAENYGVYFYCNHRLIVKELRTRDVGYFISSEAGVPHPDASLCRVIVELQGPAELMPWNSTKSGLNYSHPAFVQLRPRLIDFVSYFSSLSRRLKREWDERVFRYDSGDMEEVDPTEALSSKKKVLPKLPSTRKPSRVEELKSRNKKLLDQKPWTLGLVEAMGLVDLITKQKLDTKNRAALILLDSNLEIALKEFIVNRTDLFPPFKYKDSYIVQLFEKRSNVIKEVVQHVSFSPAILGKINYYYTLRNKLVHERATVGITDGQIEDYRDTVERVLKDLFDLKFPKA